MYKIGVSCCGFDPTEENFKELQKNKIDAIEISLNLKRFKETDLNEVKKFSERYGIELWSYHLPFYPFSILDICTPDNEVRSSTIKVLTEHIKLGSSIGIDKFVIHPSGEPISDEKRNERIKYSMQSLDTLAEIADKCGAVIAVEDLPRTCLGNTSEEIIQLISANSKLRVCFDTNHLLSEDNVDFIKKLADKIITVHISDYDFTDEKHWLPGEGKLDWNKMLKSFEEVGYNGVWMYELGLEPPKTLTRNRRLTFNDFYNNAMSIFNYEKPKIIGEPNCIK